MREKATDKWAEIHEGIEDIDPEVWKRLPFWVRDLLKMLRKGNHPE